MIKFTVNGGYMKCNLAYIIKPSVLYAYYRIICALPRAKLVINSENKWILSR